MSAIDPDLTALATLAPLVGGIAIDGLQEARTNPMTAQETGAHMIDLAERFHDMLPNPIVTQQDLNQRAHDIAVQCVAYIINHGRTTR